MNLDYNTIDTNRAVFLKTLMSYFLLSETDQLEFDRPFLSFRLYLNHINYFYGITRNRFVAKNYRNKQTTLLIYRIIFFFCQDLGKKIIRMLPGILEAGTERYSV